MKIDRLIGIITCLLQTDKITAPELSRRFEVSRRTIMRDVEVLSKAGIPIVTTQGGDGGISIMDGYRLDKSLLTRQDLQMILAGLQSIQSVSTSPDTQKLLEKLTCKNNDILLLGDSMMIDLSSFYKDSLSEKIELLKEAIAEKRQVSFRYYYNKGEENKAVEPYQIVFKWSGWYLFGFCTKRQDFRIYKLNRLWELSICTRSFAPREVPEEKKQFGRHITDDYFVTAVYAPSEKYKLVEEYGPDSFTVQDDGWLWTRWGFTDPEATALWFLGFGDKVKVLEPPEMVDKLRKLAEKIANLYNFKT